MDIIIISLNLTYSRHDMAENCSFGIKPQPLATKKSLKIPKGYSESVNQ